MRQNHYAPTDRRLDTPDAGSIHVGDRMVSGPGVNENPEQRRVGMVMLPHVVFSNPARGYGSLCGRATVRWRFLTDERLAPPVSIINQGEFIGL